MPVSLDEAIRLHGAGFLTEAEAAYRALLAVQPRNGEALHYLGFLRFQAGDADQAVTLIGQALAIDPNAPGAHFHRGTVLAALGRRVEALASLNRVLALRPGFARALNVRSEVFHAMGRTHEAMADIDRSLAIDPRQPTALNNRATLLLDLGRLPKAVESLNHALALAPDLVPALCNRGAALRSLQHMEEARADFARALTLAPGTGHAASEYFYISAFFCDWKERDRMAADFKERIAEGQKLHPWHVLAAFDDPALQLQAAKNHAPPVQKRTFPRAMRRERLRVAYLSPDFRDHPVAYLMAELFERHDRARFESFGICLQDSPPSPIRTRVSHALEHFVEMGGRSDSEVVRLLEQSGIDIAIDLAGYTSNGRPGVFRLQPAPLTVSYIGYPGTMGSNCMDYILADGRAIPPGAEEFFSEKVVRLPDCFFPAGTGGHGDRAMTRAEAGLPQGGFVFCCFNNSYKFTPPMFDIWMRLLRGSEGSVLWLPADNARVRDNLRKEAEARGVAAERLIFAERQSQHQDHLARLGLADLFLDTLPYNAHTTASDALLAGVPLITCMGESFAARVAGSMLHAVGMEELIASDLVQYEKLALELARDPQRLATIRATLARNRATVPLFDMAALCRHIEAAYETMWDIHLSGEKPRNFNVGEDS